VIAAPALAACAPAWLAAWAEAAREVPALEIVSGDTRLAVELLDDGLIHFEFAPSQEPRGSHAGIPTTPMVLRWGRTGAKRLVQRDV